MLLQKHLDLWNKIKRFSIGDTTAVNTFSRKLSEEHTWSPDFTQRAIDEYKKFIFLCCISEKGAAPSHTVDEVWHLHLTYTRSYWKDFCRDTLEKEIHHFPSAGGDREDLKHKDWYKETLELYASVFGHDPPPDIWPPPQVTYLIPEDTPVNLKKTVITLISFLILAPFIFIKIAYGSFSPFSLNGPAFLIFFPVYTLALICAWLLYIHQLKKHLGKILEENFPEDVSPFEMAYFLHGKHRAVQTGIVDLIKRNLLAPGYDNYFTVKKENDIPDANETNPLVVAYTQEAYGSRHSYEDISINWFNRATLAHPVLEAITEFANRKEHFLKIYMLQIAIYGMLFLRLLQAFANDRPVGFLTGEAILVSIPLLASIYRRKVSVTGIINKLYKKHHGDPYSGYEQVVPLFALKGMSALSGFTEASLLMGAFGIYAGSADHNSSGGCSGGGGESSCGGGGCGGCGGGGD